MEVLILSVLAVILTSGQWMLAEAGSEAWCSKIGSDCYFTLVANYGLTMMHGKVMVKAKDGKLYSYDTDDFTNATTYPADEVITADAYPEPKFVMAFNGTIPGPVLHMYEGQTIHLRVINKMLHETASVHLHGQHQRKTPFSDGVPFVSQCPILPGQIFTQIFVAYPTGTFFYHSHSGPQLTNGMYGAFIVHPKIPATFDVSKLDAQNIWNNQTMEEKEHILIFQDYNHFWDANMETMKMRYGLYQDGMKLKSTKNIAGINYSGFIFHAGLINGRGRLHQNGNHNGGPLSTFTVKSNTYYRFRLLNAGDIYPFRVTIDSHPLLVVATDGYDIDPVLVDSVVVNVGERFDVVIRTDQSPRNYLILGQTLEVGVDHIAEAILNYEGTPMNQEPTASPTSTATKIVMNCPFSYYPEADSTICYNLDRIRSRYPNEELLKPGPVFQEYFMNFAFPGITSTPSSVNGRVFVEPSVSYVTQPHDDTLTCSRDDCGADTICHCPYSVTVERDAIVQLIFSGIGSGKGWDHPVHLHGHGFQVMKIVYPTYDNVTGKFIKPTEDIECKGSFCNEAKWRDPTWNNGNVPGIIQLRHAPTKDNIIVPSGGYVVVRFKADNPGLWIVHCHIGLHFSDGMAALVSEDKPNWPERPKGFPTCNNYEPNKESPSGAAGQAANYVAIVTAAAVIAATTGLLMS